MALATASAYSVARADGANLEIEFNKIEQSDAGCRLTFKTTNQLAAKLESFSVELYLLDPKGVALESVQFTFGAIASGKARFSKFDIKDHPCSGIGAIFVNELKSCMADTDIVQQCRDALRLKNLTPIKFSDGAA